jgi:hypothetical protein
MLKKELIQDFKKFVNEHGYTFQPGTRSIAFQAVKGGEVLTFEKVKASYNPHDQDITGRGEAHRLIKDFLKTKG